MNGVVLKSQASTVGVSTWCVEVNAYLEFFWVAAYWKKKIPGLGWDGIFGRSIMPLVWDVHGQR